MIRTPCRNGRTFTLGFGALLPALAFVACTEQEKPTGQLVLALQTDLALPKDIDTVRIQVRSNGRDHFDRSYPFGPGENKIPATLTLLAGDDPKQPFELRVLAFRQGEIRTLSKTITTIPAERTALLRVPIQWFCYRQAEAGGELEFRSTCETSDGPDSACLGGTCVDANVDSKELPDFEPEVVFGGGESATDPEAECFPTETCFDAGLDVVPDADCVVEVPDSSPERLNFAVVTAMAGICSASTGACYVPLDRTRELGGWTEIEAEGSATPRYALPAAVCERLEDGRGLRVRATRACSAKTASRPTCGEWSSVSTPADDTGAAGESGVGGADGGGEGGTPGTSNGGVGGDVSTAGDGGAGGAGSGLGGTSQGGSGGAVAGTAGVDGGGGTPGLGGGGGTAGIGGGSTAGVGAVGGSGGTSAPFCAGMEDPEFALLLDDLEDGDITLAAPRDGSWFAYGAGNPSDTTPPLDAFTPTLGAGSGSMYGAALSGNFLAGNPTGIGFTIDQEGSQTCTFDGQQYSAISFEYHSTTALRVLVLDEQRTEPVCSGECVGNAIELPSSASYTNVEVTFDQLDYGTPGGTLDRERLIQIRFEPPSQSDGSFEFAIDNVAFTQVIGTR
jgi:hypothetical protein